MIKLIIILLKIPITSMHKLLPITRPSHGVSDEVAELIKVKLIMFESIIKNKTKKQFVVLSVRVNEL